MRIKRLEIQGFKSFAERTVLHFGDGITGVVGPNGCGKSNIVDALRWAMGEQSAKHLRGAGMEDVIFAGSESRGPMSMSEVTITFKNDGDLVPPEYKNLSEISVTRRLFRDGTSEYCINKQLARLKDVVDLFLGTGIGTKSYSIIEQGRIGLVVTAKPEDRRSLIEDAAGITKYKARRKQAERRLEAAEQNLVRVNDITGEMKKRLASLERQAKKAEKYRELKTELKALDLWAASHKHLELIALERLESTAADEARDRLENEEAALSVEEGRIRDASFAIDERERDIREKTQRLAEIEQALAVGSKNVEHLERELAGLGERRSDAERELELLRTQRAEAEAERAELIDAGDALDASTTAETDRLEAEEAALAGLASELAAKEGELDRHKQALVDCLTGIAQQESTRLNLDRTVADLDHRVARTRSELAQIDGQRRALLEQAEDARRALADNRQLKLALEDRRAAQEALLEELQTEYMDGEARILSLRGELMDKRSRLGSLIEIQKNYEGCQQGVRAIMRQAKENPSVFKRLHGLVADVLTAPSRFEAAVEAVLGDRLQYVIVSDQGEGIESISYLKKTADGRSTFIPLDLREDHVSWAPRRSSRPPSKNAVPHVAALAARGEGSMITPHAGLEGQLHVRGDLTRDEVPSEAPDEKTISDRPPPPELQQLADRLQQGLIPQKPQQDVATSLPYPDAVFEEEEDVWPDLAKPGVLGKLVEQIGVQSGYESIARVLLGDVVVVEDLEAARAIWQEESHRKTIVTLSGEVLDPVGILSGGSNQGVSAGLLAKKREIQELTVQVEELEGRLATLEARHAEVEAKIGHVEDAIRELSKSGHEEDLSIVKLEQDVRSFEARAAQEAERHGKVEAEISQFAEERSGIEAELERSRTVTRELDQRRVEAEARVAAAHAELAALKQQSQALHDRVTELKIAVASTQEKRDSSRRGVLRTEARMAEIDARIERILSNLTHSSDAAEELRRRISDGSAEKSVLEAEARERREEATALQSALDEDFAQLRIEDEAAREKRRTLDAVREAMSTALLRLREHQLARQALHTQIEERYQLSLHDVLFEHHLAAPQGPEHGDRREELRKKIDGMGEINLMAIDEHNEVRQRYDFLTRQQADLEKAISMLKAAIKKINRTTKDRYLETFNLVNEKFQLVFPRLFDGGRASLVLSNPADPLESGIEMLAQPPGKKLQSVNLFSGGEKALTAVALIFSIFLIKPTPFCLLDEVDAPLDDANVGRYNDLVKDMSQISQFIIITHNKRTMEIPDRLYGVTMEEPGISKLVSVDIKSTEQHLRLVS